MLKNAIRSENYKNMRNIEVTRRELQRNRNWLISPFKRSTAAGQQDHIIQMLNAERTALSLYNC